MCVIPEPALAVGHNTRGLARQKQGDLDGAVADFSQAIVIGIERLIEVV